MGCILLRMDTKKLVTIGMAIGSFIGGYIPGLWGAGLFSFSSILFTALGGLAGIWAGYQFAKY